MYIMILKFGKHTVGPLSLKVTSHLVFVFNQDKIISNYAQTIKKSFY